MTSRQFKELLQVVEEAAELARIDGQHKLRAGLLSVAAAAFVGLEAEALEALAPVVAQACERAEAWRQIDLLLKETEGPFSLSDNEPTGEPEE